MYCQVEEQVGKELEEKLVEDQWGAGEGVGEGVQGGDREGRRFLDEVKNKKKHFYKTVKAGRGRGE